MFLSPSVLVRSSRFCVWPLIFAVCCAFLPAAFASPVQPDKNTPPLALRLSALHRVMGDSFWRAENQLQNQIEVSSDVARLFAPLSADDPLRAEYSRAASAADEFIQLADKSKTENWMRPPVLYLGGLAKYSLGDNVGALQLLERLQAEFPDCATNTSTTATSPTRSTPFPFDPAFPNSFSPCACKSP